MTISSLDDVKAHLRTAVQIEWSTIPPYLCALWSIDDGTNLDAQAAIHDVVLEEMLHLTLVSNLLNALGESPVLDRSTMPSYPTFLPHSDDEFEVQLLPLCRDALATFRKIELPAPADAPPEDDRYHTIAQFYEAVEDGLRTYCADPSVWTGDPSFQVGAEQYYGGGGKVLPVADLASALAALTEIVDEGEGAGGSIYEVGDDGELAHYYRFDELYQGRRYKAGDTIDTGPTGPPILVDYDSVRPMIPNPKAGSFPPGSELRAALEEFNRTYATLTQQLTAAFGGQPNTLVTAVQTMYALKYQATALMNVPVGDGKCAGPPFELP